MSLWTRARRLLNTDKPKAPEPAPGHAADTPDAPAGVPDAPEGAPDAPERPDAPTPTPPPTPVGLRDRHPSLVRAGSWTLTGLAAVLVFVALLLPNEASLITPEAFAHLPGEVIIGAAVLLVLPPRAGRVAAAVAGAGLGLLTLLKFLDLGFYTVLDRPFDLVLDWILFDDAESFLRDTLGRAGAIAAVIGIVILTFAVVVLITLAVVRLAGLMVRHSGQTTRTTLLFGTVWVTCTALGVQVAGVPVTSRSAADLVRTHADLVSAGLKDGKQFAKEAAVDHFRDTPPDQLLTALRGKDVIFTFIESYGRSAIEDPAMAPQVGEVLDDGTERLKAAGFASESGWLTSPVAGAGSWLAHSTFMSGMWIKNQQRYRSATSSDRLTLTGAFGRTGDWRTVGIMPGVTRSWPEGKYFGLDNIYDSRDIGYKGPKFSWSPVPDQYSLDAYERLEHGKKDREPLMTEIVLASSHNPWSPIPKMVGWDEIGDGSVYHGIKKEGTNPTEVLADPEKLRNEYRRAIEYSLSSLISYVEKYGTDDTVLVFLGDHQPNATVTGPGAGRDVPISIVARDPKVLDRVSDWGWQDGLKPGPDAPVWRMDTFRDRFLTAYGPQAGSAEAGGRTAEADGRTKE
ncbi:sulfatase [Streptomyces sp. NPDC056987]|uniref:sulfatase n=1 Tax=Streptomyces sp. NPDC056987 TaxID=3345988 RepID=UPI00362C082D